MEKAPGQLEIITQFFGDLSPQDIQCLTAVGDLYKEWNAKINLISRKDIDGLYEKHILHSLAIAAAFDFKPGMEVIDIGTGGGFPGIPLAIFFPQTKFHLVDSIGKKLKVVDAVASAIGLTNVTTAHTRVENIKNRKFDVAVSRAVAPLKDLCHWSRPLLRKPRFSSTEPPSTSTSTPASTSNPSPTTPPYPSPTSNPSPSGLICLKGGDLAAEISASGLRPHILEIYQLFPLDYFHEKYLLQVPY
jgi:16S rRNA (guanine527-N7)-methyltransferase